jgi:hypothetical protein
MLEPVKRSFIFDQFLLIAALPLVMKAQLGQMTLIITTFNPFHMSDTPQDISQKGRFW